MGSYFTKFLSFWFGPAKEPEPYEFHTIHGFHVNNKSGSCYECREKLGRFYRNCGLCDIRWHEECIPTSSEDINLSCHPKHPLKLLENGRPSYSKGTCGLCQRRFMQFAYHCSICDFSVHVKCAKDPPKLRVYAPKCHEHELHLLVKDVDFLCNACGTPSEGSPYVCTTCFLMFHQDCIKLPHVININRHDHRISHTYSVPVGDWVCEICRQDINWRYGAFTCKLCPDFLVHSTCATREDVWDGVELEDVPEEEIDISPFKVIEEGVISHFSHKEHSLRLIDDVIIGGGYNMRCEACTHLIFSGKHYSCMECDYVLHETCANLPLQKRHGLHNKPMVLNSTGKADKYTHKCKACLRSSNGFMYICGQGNSREGVDVVCASLSWFKDYDCHPHTLFLTTLDEGTCGACNKTSNYVLRCMECDFCLDFGCATLPKKIKHNCDDHVLLLRYGEKAKGKYWCEICETVLDPEKWFYTCDDCAVVCHIDCLLGDFGNIKLGITANLYGGKLVPNDRPDRPKCRNCFQRVRRPFFYKYTYDWDPIPSYQCLQNCRH